MIHKAAGILFVTNEGKALFLKRGTTGDAPGTWCWPGGTTEGDETPEQTAVREANEELGMYPTGAIALHTRSITNAVTNLPNPGTGTDAPVANQVDFTTFVQRVDKEFTPALNGEHTGYAWADLNEPPQPLHPGCWIAISRFTLDELGVARAMMTGELTSPQLYGNMHLFDMRITGTGVAYRNEKSDDEGNVLQPAEFVYRRPENYLTDEFVARCNGLQVVMMHPAKAVLDSKEFAARTVGAMMLPYIKGDEVWGIAKIYDDVAIKMLTDSQMSTSPGVILGGGDQRYTTDDGTPLLIEGKPSLLDHLAICEKGVWDKGGEPRGVRTDTQSNGVNEMPLSEEEMKALDERQAKALAAALPGILKDSLAAVRADDAASTGSKLDQILTGLGTLAKRVDAMEEKEKKADADEDMKKADAACFGGRADGESDDDFKKRFDAAEAKVKADAIARGDSEEDAGKRAMDARKDAEEEEKKKADARKDADEEAKKKADAAASDMDRLVAANTTMAERIIALEKNMPKQLTDEDRHAFAAAQARADNVFSAFGKPAPYPLSGETVLDYRKRLVHNLKDHSPTWKDVPIMAFDSAAFKVAEDAILIDAAKAALHPADLKDNELRPIHKTDDNTGVRTTTFVGNRSFIHAMKRPSRYVTRIGAAERARA